MWLALCVGGASALSVAPSWANLRAALPSLLSEPLETIDAVHHQQSPPPIKPGGIVLYRERNGWCPYSERAWLALELNGASYVSVLIDNTGGARPTWFRGTTPRVRWADGAQCGESMDIVRGVDARYPTGGLYAHPDVDALVAAMVQTLPKQTRPSSRAAYLFKSSGAPVLRSDFEATLQATDALLAERGGPFFCGSLVSAADVAWAPFLERFAAQLPLLHDGLRPRDALKYPRLAEWYLAMERRIPAYFSRVRGDAPSWARVLESQGFGNGGAVPEVLSAESDFDAYLNDEARTSVLWRAYAAERDGLGRSPAREVATRIVRNSDAISKDALKIAAISPEDADEGLRCLAALLLDDKNCVEGPPFPATPDSPELANAARCAAYLVDRLCVPRDMGAPPAAALRRLAKRLAASLH
ncbi:hypothetical protein M885DRAFT_507495 [Pelagophyceae sp. CCMP2097]|nr:hypothetical protein M885DRAFT_507495 [Pelagophyceae sp. CCMP2097]|mmetsp:Transcript_2152/g.7655  ORF Transcript_2152/g.7655 Transcript_2152/m.7655 type:complete len:415 (-) Transcript_2152:36-1280(-)